MIPTTRGSLLNRLRQGQSELAWEDFVAAYQPILWKWASKSNFPGEDAEEILSEIYMHLLPRLKTLTYIPEKRFRGWLKQTVLSAVASYRSKKQRQIGRACDSKLLEQVVCDDSMEELADEIDSSLTKQLDEADAIVRKVKKRIKTENWKAFLLTYVEGLECAEAAKRLEMPLGAVHVARCRVRAMLSREGVKALNATKSEGEVAQGTRV